MFPHSQTGTYIHADVHKIVADSCSYDDVMLFFVVLRCRVERQTNRQTNKHTNDAENPTQATTVGHG